jgi:hypothetical protein
MDGYVIALILFIVLCLLRIGFACFASRVCQKTCHSKTVRNRQNARRVRREQRRADVFVIDVESADPAEGLPTYDEVEGVPPTYDLAIQLPPVFYFIEVQETVVKAADTDSVPVSD